MHACVIVRWREREKRKRKRERERERERERALKWQHCMLVVVSNDFMMTCVEPVC